MYQAMEVGLAQAVVVKKQKSVSATVMQIASADRSATDNRQAHQHPTWKSDRAG